MNRFFRRYQFFLEFAAVFIVFYLAADWTVPDSNEAHYISKAIHFWQPDYIPDDDFLGSKDSHLTFYFTFGWLSFFYASETMAYIGRFTAWMLLAVSWQKLSFAVVPVRWASIVSAAAMAYYVDSFNMAGEWFLGGVEAKCFAFPLVFLGIETMLRGKWNRCWLLLGTASAFHVLAGGWTVLICLIIRIMEIIPCPFRKGELFLWKGKIGLNTGELISLFIGGGLSLFGLIPALMLDIGTPNDIILQARQIYVFDRLSHHLSPAQLPWTFPARFALLAVLWFAAFRFKDNLRRHKRFNHFVYLILLLSVVGLTVSFGLQNHKTIAAEILRFYWFRLSDIAVPLGVALGCTSAFVKILRKSKTEFTDILPFAVCWIPAAFCVYLFFDYLVFGVFLFSWRPPELGIPWLLTLLLCFTVVKSRLFSQAAACKQKFAALKHSALFLLYTAVLFYAPFTSFNRWADLRTRFCYARTESDYPETAYYWRDICRWIADEKNTPPDAKFWVPRDAATFKWFAHRSDTGLWKDVPQDAASIVKWYETMKELFGIDKPELRDRSLTVNLWWKKDEDIEALQKKYRFDYIVCTSYPDLPQLKSLQMVYENPLFRIYKVEPKKQ